MCKLVNLVNYLYKRKISSKWSYNQHDYKIYQKLGGFTMQKYICDVWVDMISRGDPDNGVEPGTPFEKFLIGCAQCVSSKKIFRCMKIN